MKSIVLRLCVTAAMLLGIGLAPTAATGQQVSTVGGMVVNFGLMPAEVALRADGHRDAHPAHPPSGSQHVLITLADEKTGTRIGDAEVSMEVTDPHRVIVTKPLLHTQGGGFPDYSELFTFGWSGEYRIRVVITPRPGAKPIEARFTVHHSI